MAIQGPPSPKSDALVATLLWRELRFALRATSRSDAAWILIGGGLLLSYGAGTLWHDVRAASGRLRDLEALWWPGLPIVCMAVGLISGWAMGGIAEARSRSPFLTALPLSTRARHRMAAVAVVPLGVALGFAAAGAAGLLAALVGRPTPLPVAALAFAACGLGYGGGVSRILASRPAVSPGPVLAKVPRGVALGALDRRGLAWFGAWAWNLPGGRLVATGRVLGWTAVILVGLVLSAGASLARHDAGPGIAAGMVAGLSSFMLTLRCRPLASPVLRAAPLGFARACLRLMRLPALLSATVFLMPAGAALAAEPAAWAAPVSGALWLGGLNAAYGVFAIYFLTSPLLAAASFAATLGYAAYESIEYGSAVYLPVAALLALLWVRARGRYRHG